MSKSSAQKTSQLVRIHARVPWITHFNQITGEWLGACIPLNLNAAGETYEEMQSVAYETMSLLFEDLIETGEFDEFLRRNGWTSESTPRPGMHPRFDVPTEWREEALDRVVGV